MGTCETFLGNLIQGRDDIFLSTKYFPGKKYKSGALTKSFEESCKRLGRDSIDLFWIHVPNHLTENLKEAIALIKAGRIGKIGISNVSLEHIKSAKALLEKEGILLGGVQNHFSLLRNDQSAIMDFCKENKIDYYAYMVMEQGALSGHYNDKHTFPLFSMRAFAFPKRKFKRIAKLLDIMKELAQKYDIDASQIPILWVIGKGAIPIVGLTKPAHAETLYKASHISLTAEEVDMLEKEALLTGIRQQGVWEPQ
jgi:aryl-alcohol dehydrogenase-like predicted oxidoreductase